MWLIRCMMKLLGFESSVEVVLDACMHGGRDIYISQKCLSDCGALLSLAVTCDILHEHAPGISYSSTGVVYHTFEEAVYPWLFSERAATIISREVHRGLAINLTRNICELSLKRTRRCRAGDPGTVYSA